MSIILKGIDLPKDRDCVNLSIYQNGDVYEQMDNGFYIIINAEAIQIPKGHGDIKDITTFLKDKSLYEHIENDVFNKKYSYLVGIEAIYNAPTILEAEESNERQ